MRSKNKIFAVFAVLVMLASSIVIVSDANGSDAAEGVLESMYEGSWTWDRETGIGPFNTFYGAFDISNGNRFVSILDPYDLTKRVDGTNLGDGQYNIMWIIPTVYWQVDTNGNLEVSNNPSKGTAYAHTIDGRVYSYIAIGVYEATTDADNRLSSESGKAPTVYKTRGQFRDMASQDLSAGLGTGAYSMLWNFYQWELYKYLSLITMAGFNSQNIVGWGNTYGSTYTFTTGSETDTLGPYAGKISSNISNDGNSSAKLYLENTWGAVNEFVDGIIYEGGSTVYIDTNHKPTDATAAGTNVESLGYTVPSGFPDQINTTDKLWGLGTNTSGNATVGLTDRSYGESGTKVLYVGGTSTDYTSVSVYYGLSYAHAGSDTSNLNGIIGSRLAFVFDSGPLSPTPENYDYILEYDASKMGQTAAQETQLKVAGMRPISHDVPRTYTVTIQPDPSTSGSVSPTTVSDLEDTQITVSGTSLTIGSTTVVAVPNVSTAQYDYEFDGWYYSDDTPVTDTTLSSDITIIAKFTNNVRAYYVVIEAGQGGSVDPTSLANIPYGSEITINGSEMTIASQTVTATAGPQTAQYTYSFGSWTYGDGGTIQTGDIITGDTTIRAVFTPTIRTYTITFQSSDPTKGTVEPLTIQNVPYGTEYTVSGYTITLGDTTVTATPSEGYELKGWNVSTGSIVIADQTITAAFGEPVDADRSLLNIIPIVIIITILMFVATAAFNLYKGGDMMVVVKLAIGLTVCIAVFAGVLMPILNG